MNLTETDLEQIGALFDGRIEPVCHRLDAMEKRLDGVEAPPLRGGRAPRRGGEAA